jgi:hypothetical protein
MNIGVGNVSVSGLIRGNTWQRLSRRLEAGNELARCPPSLLFFAMLP